MNCDIYINISAGEESENPSLNRKENNIKSVWNNITAWQVNNR